jgi:hypothetical protein
VEEEEEPDRSHRHHRGPYPDGGEGGAGKAGTGPPASPRSAVVAACRGACTQARARVALVVQARKLVAHSRQDDFGGGGLGCC